MLTQIIIKSLFLSMIVFISIGQNTRVHIANIFRSKLFPLEKPLFINNFNPLIRSEDHATFCVGLDHSFKECIFDEFNFHKVAHAQIFPPG